MQVRRLSATQENYLESIFALEEKSGSAHVLDIAASVGVHKSTVTAALKTLSAKGLVNYAPYGAVTCTPEGRRIAGRVAHSHEVIRDFLQEILLVDPEAAEENACRMEHVMDPDVMDRLVLFARYARRRAGRRDGLLGEYARNVDSDLGFLP